LNRTAQPRDIYIITHADGVVIKIKIAAIADILVEQETDIEPQRMTAFIQECTAWQPSFQKIARIIT
jgi:hypothetical protein